jgi:lipoprotein-anchoring transpeptidase ErfK/SrfK
LIVVVACFAVLLAGAVAVYAYDKSREDRIAEGVTVAGVDVGGLSAEEARNALGRRLTVALRQPLTVTVGKRDFPLDPAGLSARADVGGMIEEALRESREGNAITRTVRDLSGADADAAIEPRVGYSRRALNGFVRRVKQRVDRPVRDATVKASGAGLRKVQERAGQALDPDALRSAIADKLADPTSPRLVEAEVEVTRPRVTVGELEDRYPYFITVDRAAFRLHFYRRLRRVKSYAIAVGRIGYETPEGVYHIQNKAVNPAWSVPNRPWAGALAGRVIPPGPENPIKERWMGIYDGAGIHGTDDEASLGSRASRGCIRMRIPEVKELYAQVPVRTPVYIG